MEFCNTLADFPADRFSLLVYCTACQRQAALDRERLSEDMTIPALRARLVCSACGSKATMLHIVWHGSGGWELPSWAGAERSA
jgi:hypothetical protein